MFVIFITYSLLMFLKLLVLLKMSSYAYAIYYLFEITLKHT